MVVIVIVAIVVATVVVGLVLGARWLLFLRALPRRRGRVRVAGLEASARIRRDRRGVPHVEASSVRDAAFAMGYVHAQDRLWQLEFHRRVAMGRLSEFAGAEALAVDRFIRRLGLHRIAALEAQRTTGDVKAMLDGYADGVNAVINSQSTLPLEFRLLKLKPEPWEPVHSILSAKLLALGLSMNWDTELQRFELLRRLGPDKAARLDITYPEENPTILSRLAAMGTEAPSELLAVYRNAAAYLPNLTGGSNSWVVDGTMTASGKPLLCNDPHLPPSLPSIWYQTHVKVANDFESTGVSSPGMPFPVIGHNQNVAWGFTNSFADCQDLVIEEFTDSSMTAYRTEKGPAPSTIVREVIRVKGGSDVVEEVVVTRHGPVVERLDTPDRGAVRGLALQWTALSPGNTIGALLALQRAADWAAFKRAFGGFDSPSQNVVYADRGGHIGYFLCGRIPVRRRPPSGLPVPGWDGDALWERVLTIDEVPQALDPPEHFIVTANNRVTRPGQGPYIANDYMAGYRARRITELLEGRTGLDGEAMRRIQMDTVAIPAQQVAELLGGLSCTDPKAEALRAALAGFDGDMRHDRREPLLYEEFMFALAEAALRPLCGDDWGIAAGYALEHPLFGYPGNLTGRVTSFVLERWKNDDTSLFDGGETWAEIVERALIAAAAAAGRRRGRWGRLHALPLVHQPMGTVKLVGRLFNAGSIRVAGSTDTVLATSAHPGHPHKAELFAPSWRQVMDLADWEQCTGVHYPGQSGQPGSRHYRDLRKPWRDNLPLPLAWSEDSVRRSAKRTLELLPRTGAR
jgi:penicillin amidase